MSIYRRFVCITPILCYHIVYVILEEKDAKGCLAYIEGCGSLWVFPMLSSLGLVLSRLWQPILFLIKNGRRLQFINIPPPLSSRPLAPISWKRSPWACTHSTLIELWSWYPWIVNFPIEAHIIHHIFRCTFDSPCCIQSKKRMLHHYYVDIMHCQNNVIRRWIVDVEVYLKDIVESSHSTKEHIFLDSLTLGGKDKQMTNVDVSYYLPIRIC